MIKKQSITVVNALFYSVIFLCVGLVSAQNYRTPNFYSLIDSADVYIDEFPKKAEQFLDSIPEPITSTIKGRLAYYYQLRGLINDKYEEPIKEFQNFSLALKYAKLENEYDIAGMVSLELFFTTYIIKRDATAFKYLDDAKAFYNLAKNTNGLAEVSQMYAYVQFNQNNYAKSNALLLPNLERYKNIKDDQYYYMYALFMLSSNYAHLNNLDKGHYYFNSLKALQNDSTLSPSLYASHVVTINTCFAEVHLQHKNLDSTLYYLEASGKMRPAMNVSDTKQYFNLYADYYKQLGNSAFKNSYLDSLRVFNDQQFDKALKASLDINTALVSKDEALVDATDKRNTNRLWIVILAIILVALGIVITMRYKKIRLKIVEFTKRKDEYQFMQTNHEKLKVKVRGLEDYIKELKKELRAISTIDNSTEQKEKTKALYKNLHHQSSTFLAKEENYLELINDVNIEFFTQIKTLHPTLTDSEIIICYYLFLGFKNKEIAAFLNTSTRSVESKRYRLSKKIEALDSNLTLIDYLNVTFKNSKISAF